MSKRMGIEHLQQSVRRARGGLLDATTAYNAAVVALGKAVVELNEIGDSMATATKAADELTAALKTIGGWETAGLGEDT